MEVTTIYMDERSRELDDGRRVRATVHASSAQATTPVVEVAPPVSRRERMTEFIVSNYDLMRGMTMEQTARMLGVDVRTVQRWRNKTGALAGALLTRPIEFLERMVCLLAPPPATPALPSAMVLRRPPAHLLQLEMRAPYDALARLDAWAKVLEPGVTVSRNNARMFIRGKLAELQSIRAALMHLERWQTCTPLAADVDQWIGGGP